MSSEVIIYVYGNSEIRTVYAVLGQWKNIQNDHSTYKGGHIPANERKL